MPKKVINNLNAISQIRKYIHCTKNVQFPANLVTFTEEILNGKLHVLCSDWSERCLRLLLNQTDKKSENLSMEVKRFRILALKFFKTLNRLSPKFATYTFYHLPNSYHKRYNLYVDNRNTSKYGNNSLRTLGAHIPSRQLHVQS